MRDKQLDIIHAYLLELGMADEHIANLSDATIMMIAGFIIKERRE